MRGKPAIDDEGAERHGHAARSEAGHGADGQSQMPWLADQRACGHRAGEKGQRTHDCLTQAETVHQSDGERADEAVEENTEGGGEGHRRTAPAETFFQRQNQDAGGAARAGRNEQRDENRGDDDEGIVLAEPAGEEHDVTDRYVDLDFAYRSVTLSSKGL
jgi:hypothetical protein